MRGKYAAKRARRYARQQASKEAKPLSLFSAAPLAPHSHTFTPADVSTAKKALKSGALGVTKHPKPIPSHASGRPIRRTVAVGTGHIHPDELHRFREVEGKAVLDPHERLTVHDPLGKSEGRTFHSTVSDLARLPKRGSDPISISSAHGYTHRRTRQQWADLLPSLKPETTYSEWLDTEPEEPVLPEEANRGGFVNAPNLWGTGNANQGFMFARKSSCVWRTVGGHEGEDGKKHGGSPMCIGKGGEVEKGHPKLAGRPLSNLKAPASEKGHRAELHQYKEYSRATMRKKARKEGLDPNHLDTEAAHLLSASKAEVSEHNALLRTIREKLGHRQVMAIRKAPESDWQTIKAPGPAMPGKKSHSSIDEVAGWLNRQRHGNEADDAAVEGGSTHEADPHEIFEMVLAGDKTPITEQEAYEQAFDSMLSRKHEHTASEADDSVPFSADEHEPMTVKFSRLSTGTLFPHRYAKDEDAGTYDFSVLKPKPKRAVGVMPPPGKEIPVAKGAVPPPARFKVKRPHGVLRVKPETPVPVAKPQGKVRVARPASGAQGGAKMVMPAAKPGKLSARPAKLASGPLQSLVASAKEIGRRVKNFPGDLVRGIHGTPLGRGILKAVRGKAGERVEGSWTQRPGTARLFRGTAPALAPNAPLAKAVPVAKAIPAAPLAKAVPVAAAVPTPPTPIAAAAPAPKVAAAAPPPKTAAPAKFAKGDMHGVEMEENRPQTRPTPKKEPAKLASGPLNRLVKAVGERMLQPFRSNPKPPAPTPAPAPKPNPKTAPTNADVSLRLKPLAGRPAAKPTAKAAPAKQAPKGEPTYPVRPAVGESKAQAVAKLAATPLRGTPAAPGEFRGISAANETIRKKLRDAALEKGLQERAATEAAIPEEGGVEKLPHFPKQANKAQLEAIAKEHFPDEPPQQKGESIESWARRLDRKARELKRGSLADFQWDESKSLAEPWTNTPTSQPKVANPHASMQRPAKAATEKGLLDHAKEVAARFKTHPGMTPQQREYGAKVTAAVNGYENAKLLGAKPGALKKLRDVLRETAGAPPVQSKVEKAENAETKKLATPKSSAPAGKPLFYPSGTRIATPNKEGNPQSTPVPVNPGLQRDRGITPPSPEAMKAAYDAAALRLGRVKGKPTLTVPAKMSEQEATAAAAKEIGRSVRLQRTGEKNGETSYRILAGGSP